MGLCPFTAINSSVVTSLGWQAETLDQFGGDMFGRQNFLGWQGPFLGSTLSHSYVIFGEHKTLQNRKFYALTSTLHFVQHHWKWAMTLPWRLKLGREALFYTLHLGPSVCIARGPLNHCHHHWRWQQQCRDNNTHGADTILLFDSTWENYIIVFPPTNEMFILQRRCVKKNVLSVWRHESFQSKHCCHKICIALHPIQAVYIVTWKGCSGQFPSIWVKIHREASPPWISMWMNAQAFHAWLSWERHYSGEA